MRAVLSDTTLGDKDQIESQILARVAAIDNMTYADVAEIATHTSLTKTQVQGVIASLSTKGILSVGNEKPNGHPGADQILTDRGVVVAFDLLAEGVEATARCMTHHLRAAPPIICR